MRIMLQWAGLALITIIVAAGCDDEPLSPAAPGAAQYAGADWVGPDGTVLNDPAAIRGVYEFVIGVLLAGTTRASTVRRLTFLTGTLAVLDLDVRVTGFDEPAPGIVPWRPGIIRALEKHVLQKRAGEWRIIQHQQLLVAPTVP
jgi:hypothetical protein